MNKKIILTIAISILFLTTIGAGAIKTDIQTVQETKSTTQTYDKVMIELNDASVFRSIDRLFTFNLLSILRQFSEKFTLLLSLLNFLNRKCMGLGEFSGQIEHGTMTITPAGEEPITLDLYDQVEMDFFFGQIHEYKDQYYGYIVGAAWGVTITQG